MNSYESSSYNAGIFANSSIVNGCNYNSANMLELNNGESVDTSLNIVSIAGFENTSFPRSIFYEFRFNAYLQSVLRIISAL